VLVDGEDRDMWRLYLADRSYRTALEFCRSTSQRDKVLTEQADHCFEGGEYEQAWTHRCFIACVFIAAVLHARVCVCVCV